MIQRCPECGNWCTANSRNFLKRGIEGLSAHKDDLGEYGEEVAGKFGKIVGQIIGIASSPHIGLLEAVGGYKYEFTCECGCTWGTDDDTADETSLYEHERYVQQLVERLFKLDINNEKEWKKYLSELENARDNKDNTAKTQSIICDTTAALCFLSSLDLEDNEELLNRSLKEIDRSLSLFDDIGCRVTRGLILSYHNKHTSYCALRELIHYKNIESHYYFSMEFVVDTYNDICEDYENSFLKIPKEQRKYLVLVSDYVAIPETFKVLRTSNIPNGLKILGDNILEYTLYVIHPLKDDTYIPYDEYTIELFREQLYEYRYIIECLGAKNFTVRDLHIDNKETDKAERFKLGVGGEYEGKSAEGGYENDHKSKQYGKLYNEMSQAIRCALSKAPYIPNDLVWYNHKYEWRQNCESRLEGRIVEFYQQISNKSNIGLTKQNSKKIEGEFNAMIAKVNGEYESDNSFSIKEDKEHVWEISVEFFPMTEYQDNVTTETVVTTFTQNEQYYLEELKAFLEDGEITEKERRHLERFRYKYEITPERAKELEDLFIITPPSKHKWWKFWK